ncbi:MAG TPA: pilin [Verrucomicrobiae bacterium]|nr:pilin [Verrucomicrobiae bacterium]
MHSLFAMPVTLMADTSSAASVMQSYVSPAINTLCIVGSVACVFFLVNGGINYMTSSGKPDKLEQAKKIIRNALVGLVLIFAAAAFTQILTHAYSGSSAASQASIPNLTAITPAPVSNGVIGFVIKVITGVLNNIIQSLASPFINSLAYFTKATPLMANNSTVFNLWLAMVGICDVLFTLVVALLGFHVMGASTFGFDELDIKQLLPRFALIFLALNTSIFAIDLIIDLSNAMVHAVTLANGTTSLWAALTNVVKQSAELGFPSLLLMLLFTIFAIILVFYYLCRLISLYIGAILSPLVLLLWLVPGFKDFSETAARTYIMTVFVLFVQVLVLIVAGSLLDGVVVGSPTQTTGTLMPILTGAVAMYFAVKVPFYMEKLSFASMGPRSARQLGGQFLYAVSYIRGHGKSGKTKEDVDPDSGRRLVPGTGKRKSMFGEIGTATVERGSTSRNNQVNKTDTATPKSNQPRPKTSTTIVAERATTNTPKSKPSNPPKTKEKS